MRHLSAQTIDDADDPGLAATSAPLPRPVEPLRHPVAELTSTASMFVEISRRRHRLMARSLCALTLFGLWLVASVGLSPLGIAVTVSLVAQLIAFLVIYQANHSERDDLRRITDSLVIVVALAAIPEMIFFGVFGVVPPLLAFLVHLLATGEASARMSALVGAILGVPYVIFSSLFVAEVMPDPGMFTRTGMGVAAMAHIVIVGLLFYAGVMLGHRFRAENHRSATRLEHAVAEVAAREALLRDARLELQRARGVGGPGRFTGQTLGEYQLGLLIGQGGMGEVYEASHRHTEERAAMKLVRVEKIGPSRLKRFEREARVVASLQHRNIVSVMDVGGPSESLPYIAMEYLEGETLAEMIAARGRLSLVEVVDMVEQVAEGLEAARELGVVHRDIKPQNLFLTREGTWKILDFGIACLPGRSHALTGTGLLGTPQYMAPEQLLESIHIDHRADVYSLTLVAIRALTGQSVFSGLRGARLTAATLYELPRRPSDNGDIPELADHVLRIGLAKQASDRFTTARELARHLRDLVEGRVDGAVIQRAKELDRRKPWGFTSMVSAQRLDRPATLDDDTSQTAA